MLLHVLEAGAGPPVALLHGLFGRAQNFGALARRLSERYRVLSVDLRNHGASPHAPGMDYGTMAADVIETLSAHAALPAAMLGHSMGGKVAMLAALLDPDAVERLIVADIAPVAYAHGNAQVARAMLALDLTPGLSRGAAATALAGAVPDPDVQGFLLQNLVFGTRPAWRIGLEEIAVAMPAIEGWPDLPDDLIYRGPALFLTGARSVYVTQAGREAIAMRFPAARVEALQDAGHWLHADEPEAFASAVGGFLARRPGLS